ncbi:MAG: hypothetical protein KGL39_30210 [Patescibacteria group bacterium]|nr:hypothetical protein [Patescibacteria group bacterium]
MFSNLYEEIEKGTGKFDVNKSYFVNNATNEDIVVSWAASEPEAKGSGIYTIRAGEKSGPFPQFLAYHIVKALVTREMQKDRKSASLVYSAQHRAPYEAKYLIPIEGNPQDALTESIRSEERAKLLAELKNQPIAAEGMTSSESRRKALKRKSHTDEEPKEFEGANR